MSQTLYVFFLACVAHQFPVVVLILDFLQSIVRYLPWSRTSGVVLAISPLLRVVEWGISIILLILILLSRIINHYWLVGLVIFPDSSVYSRFAYFIVVGGLHFYHVLHLIKIS